MAINFTRVTKDPMQDKDALIFSTELLHTFTTVSYTHLTLPTSDLV